MDLQLAMRVLWRFRLLVAIGVVCALGLAMASYYKVPSMQPRESEQWESLTTLFVTSRGFPWGQVPESEQSTDAGGSQIQGTPDAGRLSTLASLYMELSTGDAVLRRMAREGRIDGMVQSFPVFVARDAGNPALPMITLSAIGKTPKTAHDLAVRHLNAFTSFLADRQRAANIPSADRVVVEVVRAPTPGVLLEPRKKTRPIVVFLTVLVAVVGLAFILENLRPRVRTIAIDGSRTTAAAAVDPSRRTA
jgi:hypothetical protein